MDSLCGEMNKHARLLPSPQNAQQDSVAWIRCSSTAVAQALNVIFDMRLLLCSSGHLQLADFGLARRLSDLPADLTNRVITLWYRPPELLLGATRYGPSVDCWGVGCIFAELIIGKPLFPTKVELEQLEAIFKVRARELAGHWLSGRTVLFVGAI